MVYRLSYIFFISLPSCFLPLYSSYMDYLDLSSAMPPPGEPLCTTTPLDFSMYALEHLEGVYARRSLISRPEKSVLTSVGNMRIEVFGSRVYHALEKVSGVRVMLVTVHNTLNDIFLCM